MNSLISNIKSLARVALLILLQVVLFNELTLFDVARPFPYLLAIIYMPIRMQRWQGLLAAFFIGLLVDVFSYSYGFHTVACVFVFFIRDFFLHSILGVTEESTGVEPHMYSLGASTFILFSAGLVFVQHLVVVSLDIMSISQIVILILRSIVNTVFTLALVLIIEIIFYYKGGRSL